MMTRRSTAPLNGDGNEVLSLAALLALSVFPQLMVTFVHYPTTDKAGLPSGERFLDNVSVGGTPVQIEMYPDRLTIQNAGGLFGAVTVDKLGEPGISSARNAVLIRMLEDVPIPGETRTVCENRGSGIPTMLQALRSAGMSPPRFEDRISTFSVTFPNHTLLGEDTLVRLTDLGQDDLTDSQCLFLIQDCAALLLEARPEVAATRRRGYAPAGSASPSDQRRPGVHLQAR